MTPEDLHARTLQQLVQRKGEALRLAAFYRGEKALAEAAGETGIAKTLGLLASKMEDKAALAEAERRDRIVRFDKASGWRKARESSKATRQAKAAQDAAGLNELFAAVRLDGMGRVKLQAAAVAELAAREGKLSQRLAIFREVGNKPKTKDTLSLLQYIERQRRLCTVHRAGVWLQQRASPP